MRRVSLYSAFVLAMVIMLVGAQPLLAADQGKDGKGAKPQAAASATTPVNLNTASAAELQTLPGVGASTAKLIIEHRQKSGGFKKVEELMNIKGIGEKSFLKLKPKVTVGAEKAERPDAGGKGA